jgi:hypoxanthine phosphoribosyltransferase
MNNTPGHNRQQSSLSVDTDDRATAVYHDFAPAESLPNFETISKVGGTRRKMADGFWQIVTTDELNSQFTAVSRQIKLDYQDKELTTICVAQGGGYVHKRVTWKLPVRSTHFEETILAHRYRVRTPRNVELKHFLDHRPETIQNRHCLVFDDLLDEGVTMAKVIEEVRRFDPADVRVLVMLRKDKKRDVDLQPAYVLFEIDDCWVVGAGLDEEGKYRHLQYVATLDGPRKG